MRGHSVMVLPLVLLVAACTGATSTELFSEPAQSDVAKSLPTEGNEPLADGATPEPDGDAGPADDAWSDAGGEPCKGDGQCTSGTVCNWKLDHCAAPAPLGAPCKRDLECSKLLCNWELETCSAPAPAGTPCSRHKECASGRCDDTCR